MITLPERSSLARASPGIVELAVLNNFVVSALLNLFSIGLKPDSLSAKINMLYLLTISTTKFFSVSLHYYCYLLKFSRLLPVRFWIFFVICSISQFHHFSSKSFLIISSENRFFISRAGFPPTIE